MWKDCPAPYYGEVTFTEDVFIAIYAFYGSCVLVLAFWTMYKKAMEKVILISVIIAIYVDQLTLFHFFF